MKDHDYSKDYSDDSLRKKLGGFARKAGIEVVEKVLTLYETLKDEDTPKWAKGTILSALGYFIAPLDAIPDLVPLAGFSDDLGALAVAFGIVAAHVKRKHVELARERMTRWLPESGD
ncbi:YkvA family protein [Haloferula sp. A504]|jgi:uncharacterized membrane protein YkvA (DUF1232 family)|uniref:YkvA family protein n=1 Tax=Haloferula sp. A504 TaxID=3373601 RepID=UPI0031C1455F|nr:DUF1232 domain-containing protein [Verrucomicrobiaceae bacterium E54]